MTLELNDTREEVKARGRAFVAAKHGSVHVLGTNKYGAAVATMLQRHGAGVKGFINDASGGRFSDKPVVRSADLPASTAVVNCIVEGRPIDARRNIERWGRGPSVDYFALQAAFPEELPEIDFMATTGTVLEDLDRYRALYDRLCDDTSRRTLQALINFRFNRDISFMEGFTLRLAEQYWEPFINLPAGAVFVDGGAFDGATAKEFARRYPDHGHIYCFEPNEGTSQLAEQELLGLRDVELVRKGLWDKAETLHFDNSMGSASKLSDSGSTTIACVALDDVVKGPVHLIKLDVEGAEQRALKGAERSIRQHMPDLAVCVYHDQRDFLRIPGYVLAIKPGYHVFLRHYTQGVFETVMFFVKP